jgi:hypothetical protein
MRDLPPPSTAAHTPLLPSPANAPAWIVSLLNGMFIAIGVTFVVWAVVTGLRLVLPPRATEAR